MVVSVSVPVRRGEEVVFAVGCIVSAVAIARPKGGPQDESVTWAFVGRTPEVARSDAEPGPEPQLAGSEDEIVPVAGSRRP